MRTYRAPVLHGWVAAQSTLVVLLFCPSASAPADEPTPVRAELVHRYDGIGLERTIAFTADSTALLISHYGARTSTGSSGSIETVNRPALDTGEESEVVRPALNDLRIIWEEAPDKFFVVSGYEDRFGHAIKFCAQSFEAGRAVGKSWRDAAVNSSSPLALSPDGACLAVSSMKNVVLYDPRNADPVKSRRNLPPGQAICFSPDSLTLAVADGSRVRLWDLETLNESAAFQLDNQPIKCLIFSQDGRFLVALAGKEGARELISVDAGSGQVVARAAVAKSTDQLFPVPNTRCIAYGRFADSRGEGAVEICSATDLKVLLTIPTLESSVVAFSRDGSQAAISTHSAWRDQPDWLGIYRLVGLPAATN